MLQNEHFHKIARIFILVFLCSEMQSSTQQQQQQTSSVSSYEYYFNSTDEATIEYSKHMAFIHLNAKDSQAIAGGSHICAGALIAPSVVLTAAHCIYNLKQQSMRHPSEFKILLGVQNSYQEYAQSLVYGVTHVYYPSTNNPWTLNDDVAVMLLERDVPADHATVKPITLFDSYKRHNSIKFADDTVAILKKVDPRRPHFLPVNVTELPLATCAKSYGQLFKNDMICTKITNNIDCTHSPDIGSPLIYKNKLLGIATGLNGYNFGDSPALYTDVTSHRQWIYAHIGNGTNQNSSIWGTLGFLAFTLFTLRRCMKSEKC